MAKRDKVKHPYLKHAMNIKSRKDFIEADYVDGVKGIDGGYGIRPLNEEEKDWLNKYYKEVINTNGLQDGVPKELLALNRKLRKAYTKAKNDKNQPVMDVLKRSIEICEQDIEECRENAGALYPSCEDVRDLYRENNHRNRCIYNQRKARGMLLELDVQEYDKYFSDLVEESGIDPEILLVDFIDPKDIK